MKATYRCANGVQGEAKIDHYRGARRVRANVSLFAVNPGRLRIEVASPFGAAPYTLTSNGELFQLFDADKNTLLHGPAAPCNLARMTQVEVPGHVLVWLLRGEAPLLVHEPRAPTIAWTGHDYLVTIPSTRKAKQRVQLEVVDADWDLPWSKQRLRVTGVETVQRGVVRYRATLDAHERASTLPTRNPPLPRGTFNNDDLPGARRRFVNCR